MIYDREQCITTVQVSILVILYIAVIQEETNNVYFLFTEALGTTSTKYYCQYMKENKILKMIPYNQVTSKGMTGVSILSFLK